MPNSIEKFLSAFDQFIEGDAIQEEKFFQRVYDEDKLDKNTYMRVDKHLNLYIKSMDSSDPRYSRILTALALLNLLAPVSAVTPAAIPYLEEAIRHGNLNARCLLGYCYRCGIGGAKKDLAEAIKHYQIAAEGGNASAHYHLGFCYEVGIGVSKYPMKSREHYQKAIEGGNTAAANVWGYRYQHGIVDVSKDSKKAVEFYQKAADGGHTNAIYNLGVCYEYGIGVPKDPVKAIEFYQKASDDGDGDADANYSLGVCYEESIGVPRNLARAVHFYRCAANRANTTDNANIFLERLNNLITTPNIDVNAIAHCCAKVIKRFPPSECHNTAKDILSKLWPIPNFEAYYWSTLTSDAPTSEEGKEKIVEMLENYPEPFVNCLLKDDLYLDTKEQKLPYLKLALEKFSQSLSSTSLFLILHQLDLFVDELRRTNPPTFFSLLPDVILPTFAENMISTLMLSTLNETKERTSETPVPRI